MFFQFQELFFSREICKMTLFDFLKLATIYFESFLEFSSDFINLRLLLVINSAVDFPTQKIFLSINLFIISDFFRIILTVIFTSKNYIF